MEKTHREGENKPPLINKQTKITTMYRRNAIPKTSLRVNDGYEGETIEQKVNRIVNNKEPITDSAPLIYTERKDGVQGDYDIRADKWDTAIDAMDKISKTRIAKRDKGIQDRQAQKEGFTDAEAKKAAQNAKTEANQGGNGDNK